MISCEKVFGAYLKLVESAQCSVPSDSVEDLLIQGDRIN